VDAAYALQANPAITLLLQSTRLAGRVAGSLGNSTHREKNDPKDIIGYLHRFGVWPFERANKCLAAVAGTSTIADLAGRRP
jgi:hypothetical protein